MSYCTPSLVRTAHLRGHSPAISFKLSIGPCASRVYDTPQSCNVSFYSCVDLGGGGGGGGGGRGRGRGREGGGGRERGRERERVRNGGRENIIINAFHLSLFFLTSLDNFSSRRWTRRRVFSDSASRLSLILSLNLVSIDPISCNSMIKTMKSVNERGGGEEGGRGQEQGRYKREE